jgi:hypothetical protein
MGKGIREEKYLLMSVVSLRDNTVAQKASTVPYPNSLQIKLHFYILHVL